ncbi:MAG TPA: hypothetical protein VFY45_05745 [Baekduia sp.]|nr:hypothetical protein [Baekduia sp.]
MRSMRKMCGIAGVVAALGAFGGGASASAATIGPAGTAFTGANNGEHVLSFSSSLRLRCNQVRLSGTTPSPATSSTPFTATYGAATGVSGSWCRLYIGGTFTAVNVATSAPWTLTASSFNPLTGVSGTTITTGGATTLTTAVGSCTITIPSGTTLGGSGLTWEDGTDVTMAQSHIAFTATSGCAFFGVPASGSNVGYDGSSFYAGLAVS